MGLTAIFAATYMQTIFHTKRTKKHFLQEG